MCFWGWIWFGRKYPSAIFPGAPRCETANIPGRSSARTQSANEYHHKQDLCIFTGARPLGPRNGPSSVPARRRPRKKQGRYQRDAKAPLSAVCTVCTLHSKKSTGILLVTLPVARLVRASNLKNNAPIG